jgi:predicted aspartyl protease
LIEGYIDQLGVPVIDIQFAGRTWVATLDTGFNGYLELPDELLGIVDARFLGRADSLLAGGNVVTEDHYEVRFPFDGDMRRVRATFSPGEGILIGTRMLVPYRLTIVFPDRTVFLERE